MDKSDAGETMGGGSGEEAFATNGTPSLTAAREELQRNTGMIAEVLDRVRKVEELKKEKTEWMETKDAMKQKIARLESQLQSQLQSTASGAKIDMESNILEIQKENDRLQAQMRKGIQVDRQRRKQIEAIFSKAQHADLCFLVDCTGSMESYIQEVKSKVQHVVDDIKRSYKLLNLRVAFVGYRDFCDGGNRLSILEFDRDIEQFQMFVGSQEASGGGDGPEDVLGGLDAVLNLGWNATTRVLIHITDAPCHGSRFHPGNKWIWDDPSHELTGDGRDKNGLSAEELIPKIFEKSISYYFYHVHPRYTRKMIDEFNRLSQASGHTIAEVDLASTPGLLQKSVTVTLTSSIAETAHTLSMDAAAEAEFNGSTMHNVKFVKAVPDWLTVEEQLAMATWFEPPADVLDLRHGMELRKGSGMMKIKVAPNPFSEGRMRHAFHATSIEGAAAAHGRLVAKTFKGSKSSSLSAYEEQMEVQCVSEFLAQEFTKLLQAKNPSYPRVDFQKVYTIHTAENGEPFYANLEPFMEGKFEKFSSNAGYVSGAHDVLQAFSHWTHHATKGYLMVVDLQGVMSGRNYVLSDPAIHCTELTRLVPHIHTRFGATNMGTQGMDAFFGSHECNSVCRALGLPARRSDLGVPGQ